MTLTGERVLSTVVDAEPYAWPYDAAIDLDRTALVCIDWQTDFCGPGGYVDAMGYDLNLTRAGLAPTAEVLAAVRALGMFVVHTR
jgi:nicotinamidase-related amidase